MKTLELVEALGNHVGGMSTAYVAVEKLAEIIVGAVEKGEEVQIKGLGNFYPLQRKPMRYDNPLGRGYCKGRKLIRFRPSKTVIDTLNN